jgi:AraC-like DNA-binding protein/uncharacterized RmlC-like cupin family protein
MDYSAIKDGFVGQKMIVLPDIIKMEFGRNEICKPFYITDIGFYPNAHNHFRARKKGAKEYIFIYCVEGKGRMKIGTELKKEVLPNSFHIIPKETPHEYESNKKAPWSIYWMHFGGMSSDLLYQRYLEFGDVNKVVAFDNQRIKLFNEIYRMYESEYTVPKLEFANIYGLKFISSFAYEAKSFALENAINTNLVNSVIDFLNNNLDKTFKSEEIAEHFNRSPSYLFSLFKKRTGYSLIHFFNLKKMQKACEYLKYTDLSIKEISFKTGIQDPLYFSRAFKKYFGVSPKDYRSEQKI